MNEVYRRKPAPPDWPRPEGIVTRQIDPATGMLVGPGCEPGVSEVFILGTDPTQSCMPSYGQPGMYPPVPGGVADTGFGAPPSTRPIPNGQMTRTDTGTLGPTGTGSIIVPGATPVPRAARPGRQRDTTHFPRDTTRFPRDTTRPARDTANPFTLPPAE